MSSLLLCSSFLSPLFVLPIAVQSFWEALLSFYPKSTAFRRDGPVCATCAGEENRADASFETWSKKQHRDLEQLHTLLKQLYIDFPGGKTPGTFEWYLVPSHWAESMLRHLRSEVQVPLPPFLNTTTLLCEHGKLLFNPVPRQWVPQPPRDSPYDLPGTEPGRLAIMSGTAWKQLCETKQYFLDEKKHNQPIRMRVKKSQDRHEKHASQAAHKERPSRR